MEIMHFENRKDVFHLSHLPLPTLSFLWSRLYQCVKSFPQKKVNINRACHIKTIKLSIPSICNIVWWKRWHVKRNFMKIKSLHTNFSGSQANVIQTSVSIYSQFNRICVSEAHVFFSFSFGCCCCPDDGINFGGAFIHTQ